MPFDQADYQVPKPDVYSLDGLIAWLEKQPPETEYEWGNCQKCLIGTYLAAQRSAGRAERRQVLFGGVRANRGVHHGRAHRRSHDGSPHHGRRAHPRQGAANRAGVT